MALLGVGALWWGTARAARDFAWEHMAGPWIDQERVLEVHRRRVAELGERDGETWDTTWGVLREHLLWPDDATLGPPGVAPERTAKARAECAEQLTWVLKSTYVPSDLADHLLGVRGYGRNGSDFLFARYRVNDYRIQVIYSGHATGILVVPRRLAAKPQATREYAMETIRALFVPMRPQDAPRILVGASDLGGILHGGYTDPCRDTEDALVGPSPWYAGSLMTDGSYVFVVPAKWGLRENLDIRFSVLGPRAPPLDEPILLFEPEAPLN